MISKNKAFSLIELSIVILVIGVLIAGVIQGSVLVNKFRVKAAQAITTSSDVNGIKSLAMWLETSLDNSVTIDSSSTVTRWNDRNPQSQSKISAYNTTSSTLSLPSYVENVINGLPAIQFSGTGKHIQIDPSGNGMEFLAGTNYTIFVVEQRINSGALSAEVGMFLTGSGADIRTNLQFGYTSFNFIANDWVLDWTIPVPLSEAITPRIHTLKFDTTIGKYYSMKSNQSTPYSATSNIFINKPLLSYPGARIGRTNLTAALSMAEMIVFTRALTTSEINSVEAYLGKKYAIKI